MVLFPTLPPNRGYTSLHSPKWEIRGINPSPLGGGVRSILEAKPMRVGWVGKRAKNGGRGKKKRS
jgi:hypothetical protein